MIRWDLWLRRNGKKRRIHDTYLWRQQLSSSRASVYNSFHNTRSSKLFHRCSSQPSWVWQASQCWLGYWKDHDSMYLIYLYNDLLTFLEHWRSWGKFNCCNCIRQHRSHQMHLSKCHDCGLNSWRSRWLLPSYPADPWKHYSACIF